MVALTETDRDISAAEVNAIHLAVEHDVHALAQRLVADGPIDFVRRRVGHVGIEEAEFRPLSSRCCETWATRFDA